MSERQESTEDLNPLSEDERQIERLLASLKPRESHVNRDRVMFLAGQASAKVGQRGRTWQCNRWIWPAATILSACAGLLIGLFSFAGWRPENRNGMTAAEPARRKPIAAMNSTELATDLLPVRGDRNSSDEEEMASNDSGTRLVARIEDESASQSDRSLTLLDLRDRMLAGQSDEMALAEFSGSAAVGNRATAPEPPASERSLLQRWLHDQGRNGL
jgi:hypothetical protein